MIVKYRLVSSKRSQKLDQFGVSDSKKIIEWYQGYMYMYVLKEVFEAADF